MRVSHEFGDRVQFLMIYVREAHPGEAMPAHRSLAQKKVQAAEFATADRIPWPVLVDDLEGAVHRAYGGLPNPIFLIDKEGAVAFRGDRSHGPTLRRAIMQLLEQDGRGVVSERIDHAPHMLGAAALGWPAIKRGGRVAERDIVLGAPPVAAMLWAGDRLRSLLSPVARRSGPLPRRAKFAVGAVIAATAAFAWRLSRR